MSHRAIIIVGAGGHGCVVGDALLTCGMQVLGYIDNDPALRSQRVLGLPVLGGDEVLALHQHHEVALANGIGGVGETDRNEGAPAIPVSSLRARVQRRLEAAGWSFVGVRHPSAIVSAHAVVGATAQLLAGCVVQPGARIGQGTIVNTRAVVEHDAVVGAYCHIAPGAVVCGNVTLGDGVHVGAAAVVRQGLSIAPGAVVGAGAAVVANCAVGIWVGVPARPLRRCTGGSP